MDISKLPRMSKTDAPANDSAPPEAVPGSSQAAVREPYPQPPSSPRSPVLAEAWISLVIGAILLFVFPRPIQYVIARMSSPYGLIVKTHDQQWASGAVKSETDTELVLGDNAGNTTTIEKSNIASRERGDPAGFAYTMVTDSGGNPLRYTQSPTLMPDIAVLAFAILLLIDGIVLLIDRHGRFLVPAFLLTLAVVVLNLLAIVMSFKEGGFQLVCAIAVAIGGYMAIFQWGLIQHRRQLVPVPLSGPIDGAR